MPRLREREITSETDLVDNTLHFGCYGRRADQCILLVHCLQVENIGPYSNFGKH